MTKVNLKEVPSTPGIYKFFSKDEIIYIGKAKDLKKRVSSYFGKSLKDRKTNKIKILTDRIETFSTLTEAEALILEQSLIKENLPRFNILLRDDKTYPYIFYSMDHKFPSISMKRSKQKVTKDFFGPFISAKAIKSTIKDIQKIYQLRNCADSIFRNRSRPCIEHQMQRCSAPCVGLISGSDYQANVSSSQQYLSSSGKKTKVLMVNQMKKLADKEDFEGANEIKKKINSLDFLQQEQSFSHALISIDMLACIFKLGKTGVCILSIRDGKVRGTKTYFIRKDYSDDADNLTQSIIFAYYQNVFSLPKKILVTTPLEHIRLIQDAIKLKFKVNIPISTSINANTRKAAKLAIFNATQVIDNKINQSEKYKHAFNDLSSYLGTDSDLLTIEGYDISHQSGNHAVASAIRFTNKGPQKSAYRVFNIPDHLGGNDVGSIQHVLERRIKKIESNKFPDIILIDGGKSQLNAALDVFKTLKRIPFILSIVKGSKRVRATETILSKDGIVEMPPKSQGFTLLQQIRDESHRFAIKHSRIKKAKSLKFSELELINGIGPVLREKLFKQFKTLDSLKRATIKDLILLNGINMNLAKKIYEYSKIL